MVFNWIRSAAIWLFLISTFSSSAYACNIVSGKNWAFTSKTPVGWNSVCGKNSWPGTVLSQWPADQKPATTNALLYVSVFDKNFPTLQEFVINEQSNYKKEVPEAIIKKIKAPAMKGQPNYILVEIKNAGGKHEIAAYLEGPNAYYLIISSNNTAALLKKNRKVFMTYIRDFLPMERS